MKFKRFAFIIVMALIILGAVIYLLNRHPLKNAALPREELKALKEPIEKTRPVSKKAVTPETKVAGKVDPTEELINKLDAPDIQVVLAAADELAEEGKKAVPKLVARLPNASVGLKGQIVFLLGRIGDKEAVPALIEVLNDTNAYIRRNAAEALGKIQDARAVSYLARSLFDEDISVRERSALALAKIKDKQATVSLLDRLQDEREERVKSAVVVSLGELKDRTATQDLLNELKKRNNQLYKDQVVYSLGEIGDPAAIPDLTAYINELKGQKPAEPILIFQWEQAVKTAQEALDKLQ